jgi:hypothetical protein
MQRETTIVISNKPRCLWPRCPNEGTSRGNCNNHYQVYKRGVEITKEWTWEELEYEGLTIPKQRNARAFILQRLGKKIAAEPVGIGR